MKRRLIICSSLITIILSCFSFPIFAEEVVQDSSNLHTIRDGVLLDQYFYDNYEILPYLQSSGSQRISTGINISSEYDIKLTFSDLEYFDNGGNIHILFGGWSDFSIRNLSFGYNFTYGDNRFYFYNLNKSISYKYMPFSLMNVEYDRNNVYFNDVLIHTFTYNQFSENEPIYLFSGSDSGTINRPCFSKYKLYKFSIFDYSANNGEGAYVRYYYPAKSKSSGVYGLYDAVNKTFVSSETANAFINPTNEYIESYQISSFLTSALGWIGQIFTAIIDMPIIIVFMAIGLAGVMFRWGRRIVHF